MRRMCGKRILSFLLALALCICLFPASRAAAAEALSLDQVRRLLNAEELHPQRTGYQELDGLLEGLLAPYEGKDTYTKIKALYDWSVVNVDYSWDGYSQDWAPAYDKFALTYDLAYETGLPKAYPEDMIFRAYHMLTARTGVCYDWGILFAVMARYVGIESYVHTGILRIGSWTGHHGWTELRLGGKNYIFDAQQDNRQLTSLFVQDPHLHFGIPTPAARWTEAEEENTPRDASLLPVTAERVRASQVTVRSSRSGQAEGEGLCPWGEEATVTATGDRAFQGWYDAEGQLLSQEPSYTFLPEGDVELLALFEGDCFVDLPGSAWYTADVCDAAGRGIIYGVNPVIFDADGAMTRAMLVSLLARAEGADVSQSEPAPFTDVGRGTWYAGAVDWAYENGLVYGVSETAFDPSGKVTREQAAAMIVRWIRMKQVPTAAENLWESFSDADKISPYARNSLCIAKGVGVLSGYEDGTIRPKAPVTRSEGASFLMRGVRYVEAGGMV